MKTQKKPFIVFFEVVVWEENVHFLCYKKADVGYHDQIKQKWGDIIMKEGMFANFKEYKQFLTYTFCWGPISRKPETWEQLFCSCLQFRDEGRCRHLGCFGEFLDSSILDFF